MRISDGQLFNDGDYLYLSQNAWQDETSLLWSSTDAAKDSYLIEFYNSAAEEGYVAIKKSPATAGTISWTEMFKFNFDGTFLLHQSLLSPPSAAGADQAKIYIDDYLGRIQSFMKTASETVSLIQGAGINRIWRDDSFPADAKKWDLLFKPAAIRGLRFGEIWTEDNSTTTTFLSSGTFYQVVVFNQNGASNGTTPDHTNDHITIGHTGLYHVVGACSIVSTTSPGSTIEVEVRKNNGATRYQNIHFDRFLSGGGTDTGSAGMCGLAAFEENDTIELWVQNKDNTNAIIFEDINLTLVELQPARD